MLKTKGIRKYRVTSLTGRITATFPNILLINRKLTKVVCWLFLSNQFHLFPI